MKAKASDAHGAGAGAAGATSAAATTGRRIASTAAASGPSTPTTVKWKTSGPEPAAFADHPEAHEDLADEPADNPAGFGDQPSVTHGDNGREERPGRRRRRGRRGGRRGRDRDDAPRAHGEHEHGDDVAAHQGEAGNGAIEPGADARHRAEAFHEERPASADPEATPEPARSRTRGTRYAPPERDRAPERSWQAPAERLP